MKKSLLLTIICLLCSVLLFAQESNSETKDVTETSKDKLSFGTFALLESQKSGGGLTFAFPIYQKEGFFIRDEILAYLYLANKADTKGMLISLGDKLHFGKITEVNNFKFRTYGYMKFEAGITKDNTYTFFTAPIILETGGAGGFEFIFDEKKGFFFEFGGGATVADFGQVSKSDVANGSFAGGYVCLTTGYKHYF